MFFRAEKTTGDRIDSLESVTDSLMKQIIRNKSKLQKKFRSPAFVEPIADEPLYEEENPQVAKVKTFPVKPMPVEEAILQMEMLGHTFFMYRDGDTGEIDVVYKRRDGKYGVLEPEG